MLRDSIKFVDLFAGAGGLSCGLEMAGLQCVYAVESDLWAFQTFKKNHAKAVCVNEDIRKHDKNFINSLKLGKVELIVGGPPCQGFSHSNTLNRDPHDPRNSLFEDFIRYVQFLKPKVALIENVPGLLTTNTNTGVPVVRIIEQEFKKIGYQIHCEILDAVHYGIPQKRRRLFIVAFAENKRLTSPVFPMPTHSYTPAAEDSGQQGFRFASDLQPPVTLAQAISDLPAITATDDCNELTYVCDPQNSVQKAMRIGANCCITHHEPMRHTTRIVERFKAIGFGQSEEDAPEHLKPRKRGSPGDASNRTYSQNSRRQSPDEPCNTIVASSHTNFIHPILHRNFTVRESMRIQSFPDRFQLCGKRAVLSKKLSLKKGYLDDIYLDQRMQAGNAVPPLLAKAIGIHFKQILFGA